MDTPLNVTEDEQGTLRDVHDRPMIMIFSSKPRRPRKPHSVQEKTVGVRQQQFEFINVAKPGKVSEKSRQLIRIHVMQDVRNRQRAKSTPPIAPPPTEPPFLGNQIPLYTSMIHRPPTANGIPFLNFPVPMQPYMRKLLHQYASSSMHVTDPESPVNPAESVWFPLVMTDPALFHAVLCNSAIRVRILSGNNDAFPQSKHMFEAISLINVRLRHADVSEVTITTILFLAKAEYTERNFATWDIHMNGLKKIVEMRGGMIMLPDLIRGKIYDTEPLGCMETGSVPRFPFIGNSTYGPSSVSNVIPSGFSELAECSVLQGDLLSIFDEIQTKTYILQTGTASPMIFESSIAPVRYRLLLQLDESRTEDPSNIRKCLCLGAIIYVQTLLLEPPVRSIDLSIMLCRLRDSIAVLELENDAPTSLMIWISVVAAMAAEGVDREWFVKKLGTYKVLVEIDAWDSLKEILMQHYWVGAIHDSLGRLLWDELS